MCLGSSLAMTTCDHFSRASGSTVWFVYATVLSQPMCFSDLWILPQARETEYISYLKIPQAESLEDKHFSCILSLQDRWITELQQLETWRSRVPWFKLKSFLRHSRFATDCSVSLLHPLLSVKSEICGKERCTPASDGPRFIPAQSLFIHEYAHELRYSKCRVCVIHLHCNFAWKVSPLNSMLRSPFLEPCYDILNNRNKMFSVQHKMLQVEVGDSLV
jgi:hypothetical protein